MPEEVVQEVADHVREKLGSQLQEGWPGLKRPVFIVDGSSLQLPHEPALVKAYPAGSNQHGENHWPVMKVVVFHDAVTGLAQLPIQGPMYGSEAVSEQELAREGLSRLPADAVILADGNFGIFDFSYQVVESGRGLVVRLTKERALRILRCQPLGAGAERAVVWSPSVWDRKAHPELPESAELKGRIVVVAHPARSGERMYLFTTLDLPAREIADLYALRWNVETDLRSLKKTVALQRLSGRSVATVRKELAMAVTAYNLVRAVMWSAAARAGLKPRQLSFSGVYGVVQAVLPHLAMADSESWLDYWIERMLAHAAKFKLPQRSRRRSFPRHVWGQGAKFPAPRRGNSLPEESK